jgi:hypothetical protein
LSTGKKNLRMGFLETLRVKINVLLDLSQLDTVIGWSWSVVEEEVVVFGRVECFPGGSHGLG